MEKIIYQKPVCEVIESLHISKPLCSSSELETSTFSLENLHSDGRYDGNWN